MKRENSSLKQPDEVAAIPSELVNLYHTRLVNIVICRYIHTSACVYPELVGYSDYNQRLGISHILRSLCLCIVHPASFPHLRHTRDPLAARCILRSTVLYLCIFSGRQISSLAPHERSGEVASTPAELVYLHHTQRLRFTNIKATMLIHTFTKKQQFFRNYPEKSDFKKKNCILKVRSFIKVSVSTSRYDQLLSLEMCMSVLASNSSTVLLSNSYYSSCLMTLICEERRK